MAKNIKRMLAMFMVVCMIVSVLPLQVLAAEGDGTVTSTETSPEGLITKVETTTNGTGTPTVTVTITKDTQGTTEDGVTVDRHEENVTETTTEANGATKEVVTDSGHETKEWTEDVKPGDTVPTVNATQSYETNEDGSLKLDDAGNPIPVVDDNQNIIISGTATDTIPNGDQPSGPDDQNYNYTETTTDRTVTGTVSKGEIIDSDTNLEAPVAPDASKDYYDSSVNKKENPQREGVEAAVPNIVKPGQEQTTEEEGYDFFLSGLGEWTDAAAPVFKKIVYQRYTEQDKIDGKIPEGFDVGDAIPDPNNEGEYLIDEEKSHLISGTQNADNPNNLNGAYRTGMDWQPSQLVLTYKDGQYFYAYCADYLVETDQVPGHLYKIENLEDSGHYTQEDAEKLRAIVLNSYWGNAEGNGSLQSMKDLLANQYSDVLNNTAKDANGNDITRVDENGNTVKVTIGELFSGLKEHEALAVTQAAIWAYSINRKDSLDGVDKVTVVGAQSAIKCYSSKGGQWSEYRPASDTIASLMGITGATSMEELAALGYTEEKLAAIHAEALASDARMQALFDTLMGLEGIPDTNEEITKVVNEHTIQDVALVVKDKTDDEVNKDDNANNDEYNSDLTFKLAFIPGENDEMYVCLMGADDQPLLDANNQPVVKRLADPSNPESEGIRPDANGVYTLTGLQLSENVEFDLRLQGTQFLNEGAYLYTAEGGRLASQTLVGMATGTQTVKVGVTIEFNVDEEKNVVAERKWYNEYDPTEEPGNPPKTPEEPTPRTWTPPQNNRLANNTVEIAEEPVPLAAPVVTGDNTVLWIAFAMMIAFTMVAINIFDKKRHYETF